MKYQAENAVSSFFYYMWNAWSKEECKAVFGDMYRHFWDKWSALADKSIFGAAERFFAELSENNQKLLVERAVTLYDGRAFRKEPDDSDILVCQKLLFGYALHFSVEQGDLNSGSAHVYANRIVFHLRSSVNMTYTSIVFNRTTAIIKYQFYYSQQIVKVQQLW